jgi:hypothetical protein
MRITEGPLGERPPQSFREFEINHLLTSNLIETKEFISLQLSSFFQPQIYNSIYLYDSL